MTEAKQTKQFKSKLWKRKEELEGTEANVHLDSIKETYKKIPIKEMLSDNSIQGFWF